MTTLIIILATLSLANMLLTHILYKKTLRIENKPHLNTENSNPQIRVVHDNNEYLKNEIDKLKLTNWLKENPPKYSEGDKVAAWLKYETGVLYNSRSGCSEGIIIEVIKIGVEDLKGNLEYKYKVYFPWHGVLEVAENKIRPLGANIINEWDSFRNKVSINSKDLLKSTQTLTTPIEKNQTIDVSEKTLHTWFLTYQPIQPSSWKLLNPKTNYQVTTKTRKEAIKNFHKLAHKTDKLQVYSKAGKHLFNIHKNPQK